MRVHVCVCMHVCVCVCLFVLKLPKESKIVPRLRELAWLFSKLLTKVFSPFVDTNWLKPPSTAAAGFLLNNFSLFLVVKLPI